MGSLHLSNTEGRVRAPQLYGAAEQCRIPLLPRGWRALDLWPPQLVGGKIAGTCGVVAVHREGG